jgi:carboxylesterase type B
MWPSISLILVGLIVPTALCTDGLIVQTSSGQVHGFINQSAPLVRQFLGVPYAEPPIGSLRFAPPETKANAGVINATAFAPVCMQQFSNSSTIYTAQVPQFLVNGGQSEDCLYLHIWAPALKTESPQEQALPVFLYIPGGSFTSGGANSLYKIPDKWIQRTQSHIVVVMKLVATSSPSETTKLTAS